MKISQGEILSRRVVKILMVETSMWFFLFALCVEQQPQQKIIK